MGLCVAVLSHVCSVAFWRYASLGSPELVQRTLSDPTVLMIAAKYQKTAAQVADV